ncbi:MAG: hypothetical protein IPL47_09720 [Phyllobacteriaceae bacterium]|nr:hypothetical protein [Phyllobacteriaceae bacterium]
MDSLSLAFEPLIPWIAIAAIATPVFALSAFAFWRTRRGTAMRLGALGLLALALANPVATSEEREALKSVVALIVDRSRSQDFGDRKSATDAALAELKTRFARLPQFELRIADADQSAGVDDGADTRLFSTVDALLADVPPSRVGGAILLTDGQVHDVPSKPDGVAGGAPVHALVTGKDGERDRRIRFEKAPRFGIVGKPLDMSFRVLDEGAAGQRVAVQALINGVPAGTQTALVGEETTIAITPPAAGGAVVELSVEPVEGEVTTANNRAIALVDGIRENLRVLLVSGEPHAGERTWRNLLKSDAAVDLVHFTILRPPEKQDGTPISELSLIAFPTKELFVDKIDEFDLIIFDRYQHRDVLPVLYYDNIAQYVENGGALLVAAGPEYSGDVSIARPPLLPALPAMPNGDVLEEAFYPRLTDLGQRHPVTRGLEGSAVEPPRWSRWFRQIGVDKPEGDVVMKGVGDAPLLVLDRKGKGRVGMLLSDQGWLWARGFEGGGPHVQLYRRMAHWLMQEPELEEERLTAAGRGMRLEVTRQTMAEKADPARVILPSGKTVDVPLAPAGSGLFKGALDASEIGLHQIGNGDLFTLAHVGPVNAPEFADATSTLDRIEPFAKATGGGARRLAAGLPNIVPVRAGAIAVGRDWIGLRVTGDTVLKSVDRLPLFGGLLGLALLVFALGAMWWREGR